MLPCRSLPHRLDVVAGAFPQGRRIAGCPQLLQPRSRAGQGHGSSSGHPHGSTGKAMGIRRAAPPLMSRGRSAPTRPAPPFLCRRAAAVGALPPPLDHRKPSRPSAALLAESQSSARRRSLERFCRIFLYLLCHDFQKING